LISALRAVGCLGLADWLYALWTAQQAAAINAAQVRAHPEITFPPAPLVFEVQGYARYDWWLESGAKHADALAAVMRVHAQHGVGRVLEWGCGPGRILRPIAAALGPAVMLDGCDPNPACIAAARAYAPAASLALSAPAPPAPYPENTFDAVYGVSILTHLDAPYALAWIMDLRRILKPGGLAILTTHGARHARSLPPEKAAQFAAGLHVALTGARQGSRTFAAYTPVAAMNAFAAKADLIIRAHHEEGPAAIIAQDVWVLQRPHSHASAT
jgi:SAM-dependent methyltransferase